MSFKKVGKSNPDSGPLQNVKSFKERNLKFDYTFSDISDNRKSLSVLSEAYRLHSNDSSHKLNITFRHCSTIPIDSVSLPSGRFYSNMCDFITRFLQNTSGNMIGLHTELLHIWGAITTTTHDPRYGPFFFVSP